MHSFKRQFAQKFDSIKHFESSPQAKQLIQYMHSWKSSQNTQGSLKFFFENRTVIAYVNFDDEKTMFEWIYGTKLTRFVHGEFGWHRIGDYDIGYTCERIGVGHVMDEYLKNDAAIWNGFTIDETLQGHVRDLTFVKALDSAVNSRIGINPFFNWYDSGKDDGKDYTVDFSDMPNILKNTAQMIPLTEEQKQKAWKHKPDFKFHEDVDHNFNLLATKIMGRYLLEKYRELEPDTQWLANYCFVNKETVAETFRNYYVK